MTSVELNVRLPDASPSRSESRRQRIALACYGADLDGLILMVRPHARVVKRTPATMVKRLAISRLTGVMSIKSTYSLSAPRRDRSRCPSKRLEIPKHQRTTGANSRSALCALQFLASSGSA